MFELLEARISSCMRIWLLEAIFEVAEVLMNKCNRLSYFDLMKFLKEMSASSVTSPASKITF